MICTRYLDFVQNSGYYIILYIRVAIHTMTHRKACLPRLSQKVNLKAMRAHAHTDFVTVLSSVFYSSVDATTCSVKRL
jgi:hypothetical protein